QDFGYFSLGSVSEANTLPVNDIKASLIHAGGRIIIDFQLVPDERAAFYTIQQSADGRTFTDPEVRKAGNLSDLYGCQRTFLPPETPVAYFRVKMTGFNQQEIFSKILTYKSPKPALNVYPNPAVEKISIFFPFPSSKSNLEIVNSSGKVLYQ